MFSVNIISYIAANSPGGTTGDGVTGALGEPDEPAQPATAENIHSGHMLFEGKSRFTNGGPPCNVCHNVKNDGVMAGGALAKDLTDAYSRLSGAGVKAVMANPPFPVMKKAFDGKALTEEEKFDVAAFLQHVESESASQRGRDYGLRMFLFNELQGILTAGCHQWSETFLA